MDEEPEFGVRRDRAGTHATGWKLAEVVDQTSPDRLLDSYHAERHRSDTRRPQPGPPRPHDGTAEHGRVARRIAAMLCGLDIHDDLGEGREVLLPALATWLGAAGRARQTSATARRRRTRVRLRGASDCDVSTKRGAQHVDRAPEHLAVCRPSAALVEDCAHASPPHR
jgi:hypothetical protein